MELFLYRYAITAETTSLKDLKTVMMGIDNLMMDVVQVVNKKQAITVVAFLVLV